METRHILEKAVFLQQSPEGEEREGERGGERERKIKLTKQK